MWLPRPTQFRENCLTWHGSCGTGFYCGLTEIQWDALNFEFMIFNKACTKNESYLSRARLQLPVGRVHRFLRKGNSMPRGWGSWGASLRAPDYLPARKRDGHVKLTCLLKRCMGPVLLMSLARIFLQRVPENQVFLPDNGHFGHSMVCRPPSPPSPCIASYAYTVFLWKLRFMEYDIL